jgi:predicted  nucleic acid-binding Zn-ribbon protein
MHKLLQTLVMLQDLDYMIVEVSSKDMKNVEKKMGLTIRGEEQLQEAKERIERALPPAVMTRYHKLMQRFGRAVVPVVGNNCMGCYVSVPKRLMGREVGNRELRNCERCGMFLYWV